MPAAARATMQPCMRAMESAQGARHLLFGTSICYTRDNIDAVTSDELHAFR